MCKRNREDTALLTQGLQYPRDHHPRISTRGGHKQLRLLPKQNRFKVCIITKPEV